MSRQVVVVVVVVLKIQDQVQVVEVISKIVEVVVVVVLPENYYSKTAETITVVQLGTITVKNTARNGEDQARSQDKKRRHERRTMEEITRLNTKPCEIKSEKESTR
jgi:hypothetical protein